MASAGESPAESEALKHSFSYLVKSIDTVALLPVALSRNIITDRQRSECSIELDPYKKAETFLGHLQRAVNGNYDKFHTFVQILKETNQTQIATHLRDELAHTFRSMQPSSSSSAKETERVIVPDTLVEELADLRFAFANLLYSYENEIQSSPESQEKFIKFLPRLFRRDIEDHSFQSLFNMLIGEEVSLFNTHYLKRICSIFSEDVCATTKKLVDSYEQQRQHFMAGTTVSQFKQLFPASATPSNLWTGKVPVKLKLDSKWGSDTIEDLTELIIKFGVPGSHLHLSKVEDGCIAVILLCSTYEAKELKIAIFEAADLLQSLRVLQVFIGEDLVLECSQHYSTAGDLVQQPMVHSPTSSPQPTQLPTSFSCLGLENPIKLILAEDRITRSTIQYYSDNQLPPVSAAEFSAQPFTMLADPSVLAAQPRVLRGRPSKPRKQKAPTEVDISGIKDISASAQLWEFLLKVIKKPKYSHIVSWENQKDGLFCFHNPSAFAALWGRHRNRPSMTYDKVARALRYYYKRDILEQVGGRLTYKFSKRLQKQFMDDDDMEYTSSQKNITEIPTSHSAVSSQTLHTAEILQTHSAYSGSSLQDSGFRIHSGNTVSPSAFRSLTHLPGSTSLSSKNKSTVEEDISKDSEDIKQQSSTEDNSNVDISQGNEEPYICNPFTDNTFSTIKEQSKETHTYAAECADVC